MCSVEWISSVTPPESLPLKLEHLVSLFVHHHLVLDDSVVFHPLWHPAVLCIVANSLAGLKHSLNCQLVELASTLQSPLEILHPQALSHLPQYVINPENELTLSDPSDEESHTTQTSDHDESVPEPNSLSEDLNIKLLKCKLAKNTSAPALQVFKQNLHFSLGCKTKTDEGLTKSFTFTTNESSSSSPSESEEIDSTQTEAVLNERRKVQLLKEALTFVKLLREASPFPFFKYQMYCSVMVFIPKQTQKYQKVLVDRVRRSRVAHLLLIKLSESSLSSPSEFKEIDSAQTEVVLSE
ncbi:hypothetical protein Tco_0646457 [Tanacetum coccineum]